MILGCLRIKNEARWIARSIGSILPLCDRVLVLDDHSTDETLQICATMSKTEIFVSPFSGLDEARDKNWLLEKAALHSPDWIVWIDGDEMLAPRAAEALFEMMANPNVSCISLRVRYLWNSEEMVRVDGVYGDFHRESVFRPNGARFEGNSNGGNFHCGNVPWQIRRQRVVTSIPLFHFGYMHKDDRERKFHWYRAQDPDNSREDGYRHMVIGDLFPADSQFMHAGPLRLEPLNP